MSRLRSAALLLLTAAAAAALSLATSASAAVQRVCDTQNSVYTKPGNATIIGYFGGHEGEDCDEINPHGMQMMMAAINSLEALQRNIYPQITLGLSLYDTCSRTDIAQKSVVSSLVETACREEYVIGGLSDENSGSQVTPVASSVGVKLTSSYGGKFEMTRMSLAGSLLSGIGWMTIDALIPYEAPFEAVYEFKKEATDQRICIRNITTMDKMLQIPSDSKIVVITPSQYLRSVLEGIENQKIFVIPTDGYYSEIPSSSELLIFLPTHLKSQSLENPHNITERDSYNYTRLTQSNSSLLQIQVLMDMANLLNNFKFNARQICPNADGFLCPELPKYGFNASTYIITHDTNHILRALKMLNMKQEEFEGFVVLRQTDRLEKIGSYSISSQNWVLNINYNWTNGGVICDSSNNASQDCACENYLMLREEIQTEDYDYPGFSFFRSLAIKDEAWVAALLSISIVGILCSIAIAIFIGVRICKKDILEGNPGCSFLILFSLILMYLSILPFSFEVDEQFSGIMCGMKIFGTSLSFSFVYSAMLARSIMLASCDKDGGFMSHINGYIQSVLCFFIGAVQFGLMLQFWAVNWLLLDKEECAAMSQGNMFLALLSYNVFLLVLLMCISPFIAKSKRNYLEGSYFTAGIWLSAVIWIAWCAAYASLPPSWHDLVISSGLVATSTSLLVSVFIPRTYLMVTGIVRDHIVSTLPSLAHTAATSVIDINYRSTQALYDSVTATRAAHLEQNYYVERPTTPSTTRMENRSKSPENTYERYDSPPSPQNITRF